MTDKVCLLTVRIKICDAFEIFFLFLCTKIVHLTLYIFTVVKLLFRHGPGESFS